MILLVPWLLGCQPDPERVFARDVVPVLEQTCASTACHGVAPDAEARGEVLPDEQLLFRVDGGRITDVSAAREVALTAVNTVESPDCSTLLRKPLAEAYGGQPHHGLENFLTPEDPGYRAIRDWIALEAAGGEDPEPLDALEQQFADQVEPALLELGCATGGCHGPRAAVPFRLEAGIEGERCIEETRANRRESVAMVSLDGDPLLSRLLRKSLPPAKGGILHKGGNDRFLRDTSDARLDAILSWITAEREALGGGPTAAEVPGLIVVRGPSEPEDPFDLDVFVPGTDLWYVPLEGGDAVDLTGALHDSPADIRDPAVDPEGRRVAFAMRAEEEGGHDLWILDLETGAAEQLTHEGGPLPGGGTRTWREPAWAPDGTLWAVSTRAGVVDDGGTRLDADLYEIDPADGRVTRRSFTPHVERKPTFLVSGTEAGGELAFTALRDVFPGQAFAHPFRFPPGLETEYHQHFGITPPETLHTDLRELPDGRYVVVLAELDTPDATRLGIVDRNFGPVIPDEAPPALPLYAEPLIRLEGSWRDPAPLPDGRLLAVDEGGTVHVLTLAEDPRGVPYVAGTEALCEGRDPEPVHARTFPADEAPWSWDEDALTGRLHHQGLPVVQALLADLPPAGAKEVPDDLRWVRLVEHLPLTPAEREGTSLGHHGPARILAELPLAADGTLQAELPAGVAFRIQALDEDRMTRRPVHARWFDVHPGQTIPQGVQERHYTSACAACHGALDGDPDAVFVEPDLLTTASLSLARYQDQDPRRPIEAPVTGDATRIEVDFVRDVQPVLDRRCVSCHEALRGDADGAFTRSYRTLLQEGEGSLGSRRFVDEAEATARGSLLVEMLTGRELEAPGRLRNPGVPHGALDEEELLTVIRWIELGATFVGTEGS